MHPLVVAIPKFIQLGLLLLSLRPMDLAMAEPITTIWSAPVVFVRLGAGVVPPTDEEPHAVIDPSALMAATKIYSTASAFAALKTDGSITAWGNASTGGAGAPVDNGYTKIYFE
jgi:hypothetical protein